MLFTSLELLRLCVVASVSRSRKANSTVSCWLLFLLFRVLVLTNAAEESVDICGSRATSGNKTAKAASAVAPVIVRLDFSQSDEFRTRVGSIVRKSANAVPHKSGMSFVCSRFSRPLSKFTSHALLGPSVSRRFPRWQNILTAFRSSLVV